MRPESVKAKWTLEWRSVWSCCERSYPRCPRGAHNPPECEESQPMKAFALDEFGQPGTIHDLPTPEPGDGEVRVTVAAGALNPFDAVVLKGYMKDRLEHRFPLVPCGDLAGTIDAVGPGVREVAKGDRVFGITGRMVMGAGTLAEYTIATA